MSQLDVILDGHKTQVSLLLPGHTLAMLPGSLVLNMLKPYVSIRGLSVTSPCVGYWLIYRAGSRVGNMKLVKHV